MHRKIYLFGVQPVLLILSSEQKGEIEEYYHFTITIVGSSRGTCLIGACAGAWWELWTNLWCGSALSNLCSKHWKPQLKPRSCSLHLYFVYFHEISPKFLLSRHVTLLKLSPNTPKPAHPHSFTHWQPTTIHQPSLAWPNATQKREALSVCG